ncbi:MAG: hypothetical protein ACXWQA_07860 [Pseudobdellovibrionaceae bacterium]
MAETYPKVTIQECGAAPTLTPTYGVQIPFIKYTQSKCATKEALDPALKSCVTSGNPDSQQCLNITEQE